MKKLKEIRDKVEENYNKSTQDELTSWIDMIQKQAFNEALDTAVKSAHPALVEVGNGWESWKIHPNSILKLIIN